MASNKLLLATKTEALTETSRVLADLEQEFEFWKIDNPYWNIGRSKSKHTEDGKVVSEKETSESQTSELEKLQQELSNYKAETKQREHNLKKQILRLKAQLNGSRLTVTKVGFNRPHSYRHIFFRCFQLKI